MEITADRPIVPPDEHRKYRNLAAESEVTLLFYSEFYTEGGFPEHIRKTDWPKYFLKETYERGNR